MDKTFTYITQLLLQQVLGNSSGFVGTLEQLHVKHCLKDVRYQQGEKNYYDSMGKDRGTTSKYK